MSWSLGTLICYVLSPCRHHSFYNELLVAPEAHSVLLAEAPQNPAIRAEGIQHFSENESS